MISVGTRLASTLDRLDMLYLIAGVGVGPFGLTKDGLGNHFAVNHLASVVLVDKLLPVLKRTATKGEFNTRIVAESSELHRAAPGDMKCETVEEFSHEKDPMVLYGRSKLLKWVDYTSAFVGIPSC